MLQGHIKFDDLKELSYKNKKRFDPAGLIKRHIEDMGADYSDLYFIEDDVRI